MLASIRHLELERAGRRFAVAAPLGAIPAEAGLREGGDLLLAAAVVLLAVLARRLRRALERERSTTAALERANRSLEHFATLVSHDLREPLNAIVISSERLSARLEARLGDEDRELLGYVRSGTQEMRGLVDGFLSATRELEPRRGGARVSAAALVEQALAALRPRVEARGARISVGSLPDVTGDAAALRSLFQNLLSNALKFVPPERTPEIRITAERTRRAWRFTVEDNGIGVEPEEVDDVFAMLARGTGAARFPGTGLGLASCRGVVERHGGRIWIEPLGRRGTRVAFTLPVGEEKPAEAGEAHGELAAPARAPFALAGERG